MTETITTGIARIFYDGILIGAALWMGTAIVREAIRDLRGTNPVILTRKERRAAEPDYYEKY